MVFQKQSKSISALETQAKNIQQLERTAASLKAAAELKAQHAVGFSE